MQIYRKLDLLLLNLVKKYVLSDLLNLEMVLDFRIFIGYEQISKGIREFLVTVRRRISFVYVPLQ